MAELDNPYFKMLLSPSEKHFYGRQQEINDILEGVTLSQPKSFALYGLKKIGKTRLLKQLQQQPPDHAMDLKWLHLDFYKQDRTTLLPKLWEEMNKAVGRTTPKAESDDQTWQHIEDIAVDLQTQKKRLALCLDHFEQVYQSIEEDEDHHLRYLTDHLALIVVTEKPLTAIHPVKGYLSSLVSVLIHIKLGLLDEPQALQLINQPAQQAKEPFTEGEARFLWHAAGGHPYLLTLACEHLYRLRQQYPELKDQLNLEQPDSTLVERLRGQMITIPGIQGLFQDYWNYMGDTEHQVLRNLVLGSPQAGTRQVDAATLNILTQKALVHFNPISGQYDPFCDLFRDFIRSQSPTIDLQTILLDHLEPLERRLFEYLMERPNQVCKFEDLYATFWPDFDQKVARNNLNSTLSGIRAQIKKVEAINWECLQSVRGQGYKFVPQPNT